MAQFTIPKFIEREPKIVGPFALKQFVFIGVAGAICFALYFIVPFFYFILITIILILGALALAFLKINGRPLPTVLKNFFIFSISPKIYIWGRESIPSKKIRIEKLKPKKIKEAPTLKITERSQLQKLSNEIETM